MKDFKVTMYKGFDSKTHYTQADSAEALAKEIESRFAFELDIEGYTYQIESV